MSNAKRKTWLDTARGIAMIFVIFGHVGNELAFVGVKSDKFFEWISLFVNPVKVPLFFVISGYLFSMKNGSVKAFAEKMLKSRLIPYIIWGSFMGLAAFAADFIGADRNVSEIWNILSKNYVYPLISGNLIWFIPCLIVTEIIYFTINKISGKKIWLVILLSTLCTSLGYFLSADSTVKPWKIDTALTCIQFMCFGNLLKRFDEKHNNEKNLASLFGGMGAYIILLLVFTNIWNGCKVNVNMGEYFNRPAFTLLSFTGIYAFFALAKVADRGAPIIFVGKNTFIYFVWHMYAVKFSLALFGTKMFECMGMTASALLLTLVSCLLVSLVCLTVNRYFAFSVGKYTLSERRNNK